MAATPVSTLNFSVASPVAGSPVKAPSIERLAKSRSDVETSIGSRAAPSVMILPRGRKPFTICATALAVGRGRDHQRGSAEFLQGLTRAPSFVASSALSNPRAIAATSNPMGRAYWTPRCPSPHPQYPDKIARFRWGVTKRTECSKAGAQKRRGSDSGEFMRNRYEPARLGNQHLRVATIVLYPREILVAAIYKVATPASVAPPAVSAQISHADALSCGPSLDTGAEHIDHTDSLVSGHARPGDRKEALSRSRIGVANAASLDAYADIAGMRINEPLPGKLELARTDCLNGPVTYFGLGHLYLSGFSLPLVSPGRYSPLSAAGRS
jgi:hypothetical protein